MAAATICRWAAQCVGKLREFESAGGWRGECIVASRVSEPSEDDMKWFGRLQRALAADAPREEAAKLFLEELEAKNIRGCQSVSRVPADHLAAAYAVRAAIQQGRGQVRWHGVDELVRELCLLGTQPVAIHGLSSTVGHEFIVFEQLGNGRVVGVLGTGCTVGDQSAEHGAWDLDRLVVAGAAGQDRAEVFELPTGLVLVVADGAGGTGGGGEAADAVIRAVGAAALRGDRDWVQVLHDVDRRLLDRGWTTAVVVELRGDRMIGASVGDSRAWLCRDALVSELTAEQQGKPLLGTGRAAPVAFDVLCAEKDWLFLATDGLCNYLPMGEIGGMVADGLGLDAVVSRCRLPDGGLPDDVAIISCHLTDE